MRWPAGRYRFAGIAQELVHRFGDCQADFVDLAKLLGAGLKAAGAAEVRGHRAHAVAHVANSQARQQPVERLRGLVDVGDHFGGDRFSPTVR
jgi:hypothetical protein